jgi:hypothetical protein
VRLAECLLHDFFPDGGPAPAPRFAALRRGVRARLAHPERSTVPLVDRLAALDGWTARFQVLARSLRGKLQANDRDRDVWRLPSASEWVYPWIRPLRVVRGRFKRRLGECR